MYEEKNNDLFELVHALSMSEKKHFKIFSKRHILNGKNNYVRLFDELSKSTHYNETKLKKTIQINDNNTFAVTKNTLQQNLLKSLQHFHANNTIEKKLREIADFVEALMEKLQYKKGIQLINKGKELAGQYEKFEYVLIFIQLEKRIIMKSSMKNKNASFLSIVREELDIVNKLNNLKEYYLVSATINDFIETNGIPRNEKNIFFELFKAPVLKNKNQALSFNALQNYYAIKTTECFYKNEYNKAIQLNNLHLKAWEQNAIFQTELYNAYTTTLNHALVLLYKFNRYQQGNKIITKMMELKSALQKKGASNPETDLFILQKLTYNIFYHYMIMGNINKASQLLDKEIKSKLKQYHNKLNKIDEAFYYFDIATFYFIIENYNDALDWLLLLENSIPPKTRIDLQGITKILKVILYYELKSYNIIEFQVRSAYDFLRNKGKLYQVEKLLLGYFKKIISSKFKLDIYYFLESLHKELIKAKEDPYEAKGLSYFDFISWTKHKLEKRPMVEVLKEKIK